MKKIITCLLAFVCVLAIGCTCFADGGTAPWYPEDVSSFVDFHDTGASRVVDDADVLSDAEEKVLRDKIADLTAETGFDLVIYTTDYSYQYGSDHGLLAADFYHFNGYGYDDLYSGSVFMVCFEAGNRGWYSAACGYAENYFTRDTINALDDYIDSDMRSGDYYNAFYTYVDKLQTLYTTGTLTYKENNTVPHLIIAAALGIIVGLIVMFALSAGMKKVKIATNADMYVVPGSNHLRVKRDHFLYVHTKRVLRETNNNNKGGGSSFSKGFSSSGGRSFSGGGRRF